MSITFNNYTHAKVNSKGMTLLHNINTLSKFSGSSNLLYIDNQLITKQEIKSKKTFNFNFETLFFKPVHSIYREIKIEKKMCENSIRYTLLASQLPVRIDEPISNHIDVSNEVNEFHRFYDDIITYNDNYQENTKPLHKLNKSKIRNKISALANCSQSKKHLYFWTISFPKDLNDNQAFKYFNIWLTRMRRDLNLHSYIWVSERQKNGTIHFHLLINQVLSVITANNFMRATLITEYTKNKNVFNGYNPIRYNGIDIAKNRNTKRVINFANDSKSKSLAKYVTKYITKNDIAFSHLVWHCSRNVSKLFTHKIISKSENLVFEILKNNEISFKINSEFFIFRGFKTELSNDYFIDLLEVNNLIHDNF